MGPRARARARVSPPMRRALVVARSLLVTARRFLVGTTVPRPHLGRVAGFPTCGSVRDRARKDRATECPSAFVIRWSTRCERVLLWRREGRSGVARRDERN